MQKRIGKELVHIVTAVLIAFDAKQIKAAKAVDRLTIAHSFTIKAMPGSPQEVLTLRLRAQPSRRIPNIQAVTHLLAAQRDATIDPIEDIEPGTLRDLRVDQVES